MVKSTGYPYRGPDFLSQDVHGSLWLSVTSVLQMSMPSSELQLAPGTHEYTNIHVGKTVLHVKINKTFFNFSFKNKTNKAHRQLSTGDPCPGILALWSESQWTTISSYPEWHGEVKSNRSYIMRLGFKNANKITLSSASIYSSYLPCRFMESHSGEWEGRWQEQSLEKALLWEPRRGVWKEGVGKRCSGSREKLPTRRSSKQYAHKRK